MRFHVFQYCSSHQLIRHNPRLCKLLKRKEDAEALLDQLSKDRLAGSGRINSAMALTFSCLKQTKKHFFSSFQSANSRVQVECVLVLSQRSLRCVLFIVTARVVLEGLWDSFALLVVTTKALLSAVALTWILKLLEFGLVKKSFPMVYFTTFSCFR